MTDDDLLTITWPTWKWQQVARTCAAGATTARDASRVIDELLTSLRDYDSEKGVTPPPKGQPEPDYRARFEQQRMRAIGEMVTAGRLQQRVAELEKALRRVRDDGDAHRATTWHDNEHPASCAAQDCGCLAAFVDGVLAPREQDAEHTYTDLASRVADLEGDRDELVAAVMSYGEHRPWCANARTRDICDCGLWDALSMVTDGGGCK